MDGPDRVASELRSIARQNAADLDGISAEDTMEWIAAAMMETAVRALVEIRDGCPDPMGAATVALMSLGMTLDR